MQKRHGKNKWNFFYLQVNKGVILHFKQKNYSTETKTTPKKRKLKIIKGTNSIPAGTELHKSSLEASVFSKDGKKHRTSAGVPTKDGKCVFPFKNGKKYITKEDGCIGSKTGDWCATEVDKNDDYKIKAFGYCK